MEKPQSATFTVTADTPLELARLLRRIADALDGGETEGPSTWARAADLRPFALSDSPSPSWSAYHWDESRARELWYRLETPGARRALLYLVDQTERTPVDELATELGKEPGPALAGTLSPIGRAVSAMDAPPPFRRVRSHYEMDPEFARSLRAFFETEEGKASLQR
jgi:hypothetical protein